MELELDLTLAAKAISEHREELGLSQERFGRVIDRTSNAIGGWESGEKFPDFASLCALVQKAGIPAESLLGTPTVSKTNGLEVAV